MKSNEIDSDLILNYKIFSMKEKLNRLNYVPKIKPEVAPFWHTFNPIILSKWLISYLWPWNTFHIFVTIFYMKFVLPDISVMQSISWDWVLWLYFVNGCGIFLLYGFIELFYYYLRIQNIRFKYNSKFPSDMRSKFFWFKSQNLDNFLRTYMFGISIWTFIQVIVLWTYANSWGNWISWNENKIYLLILIFIVPAIHEIHFYCIHRLIHTPWLYKHIHSVHHKSINPSPWSSLSMHPIEHILYFGEIFWHLLIPSNPFVALFNLHIVGYGAVNGHIGFDKLEMGKKLSINSHAFLHSLHHKHFEVNYGADWLIPLDKWFGTWHDGTIEADKLMKARLKKN